ncbi:thiamine diphosphokinase [Malassezia sp. CBS 17886]|nr:thiamine diphosphokinase [Malassezia sp. CBS 17886]
MPPTLLGVAQTCQNDVPWDDASLYAFVVDGVQIGFVPDAVALAVRDYMQSDAAGAGALVVQARPSGHVLTFSPTCTTHDARTAAMGELAQWLRTARKFPDPLDGWRDEQYAVYGPPAHGSTQATVAFTLERSACALFGFATFGVHLTVAGGITAGDSPLESIVRECEEEAKLPPNVVRGRLQAAGTITYFYKTNIGLRQPEMQYIYDLPLPPDVSLVPGDGEAESFELMTRDEIMALMFAGEFKPNCTLVLLDFFVRHGWLTAESEHDYVAIVALLHTPLRVPTP